MPSSKNIRVTFDQNSEKVFVTFLQTNEKSKDEYLEAIPGKVCTEVYKALKLRTLRTTFVLSVMW